MKAKLINEFYSSKDDVDVNIDELEYKAKLYDEIKRGIKDFYEISDKGQVILTKGSLQDIGEWISSKLGFKAGFNY